MKTTSTPVKVAAALLSAIALVIAPAKSKAQISLNVCTDPTNIMYGLTSSGAIYPINMNTGAVGTVVKNTTYLLQNGASKANALGYNPVNNRFYYFKRNVGESPQEFVSFNPVLNIVSILAQSPLTEEVHTGCMNLLGTGYFTLGTEGTLAYYNIASNSWTTITNNFVDQFGNNVTNIIKNQDAGDIVIDGFGNLWIVTSNGGNFGVYRLQAPIPMTPQASITVRQRIAPTTPTPSNNMIAGIAFNPQGQILMSTKNDNRLYVLEADLDLTFRGTFSVNDVGNDLTSCVFPMFVLPVVWKRFEIDLEGTNRVVLNWEVGENDGKGFVVEYSEDGTNWKELEFIESHKTPEIVSKYTYTHINNGNGRYYYRVSQLTSSNRKYSSAIQSVMLRNQGPVLSIWPNPASDNIKIQNNGEHGETHTKATLYDLSGRIVLEKHIQQGINTVSIQSLNTGVYVLKLTGGSQIFSQKIVKQ